MERHELVTSEYEEIESKVIQNNYTVIDNSTGQTIKLLGIALLSNGKITALLNHDFYWLSRLYVGKDNMVHLSTYTIGGVMLTNDIDSYNKHHDDKIIYHFLF